MVGRSHCRGAIVKKAVDLDHTAVFERGARRQACRNDEGLACGLSFLLNHLGDRTCRSDSRARRKGSATGINDCWSRAPLARCGLEEDASAAAGYGRCGAFALGNDGRRLGRSEEMSAGSDCGQNHHDAGIAAT